MDVKTMKKTSLPIPIGLPDSILIHELNKKTICRTTAQSRTPNYIGWLKTLRDRIAPELSYIIVTFPLFTPHDEQNHIHPLFSLADRLLGADIIESLNATELFILACSLYSHDWGMAVSVKEKECFLGLAKPETRNSFCLLDNEMDLFKKIILESHIGETTQSFEDVPLAIWQYYIRETHAARSAQRVRNFFSSIDTNLGDAIALISESHNMDLERLRLFQTSIPVNSELVNLRALCIYLRLIDLFDLAQDRTPYALWKFVSPKDLKSADEWQKHRALSPVAIDTFQGTSRCIKVHGSTDDHSVYAALEDLHEYCDSQLRLSNGLMNELHPRYQLQLLYLDWKVEAKGFEPINIRFEFDRQAMIKVLSEEIYQGDRYVFLRELLQNSIDAIRLRRELHVVKQTGISLKGEIHVIAEHLDDGNDIITWIDNGYGMSTFIIRNYLTVAGKSFYQSEDFKKLGVKMDPISRFGIGILSCFMVADHVEIITRQDPQIEPTAETLKIEIPDHRRHLRIQRLTNDNIPFGTTIKILIKNETVTDEEEKSQPRLNVTNYLKKIAGFVEFPIYLKEGEEKTLIQNPLCKMSNKEDKSWQVASLDCSFSWDDYFLPQDVYRAKKYFEERKITIKIGTKNPLFEGVVTFPFLKEELELRHSSSSYLDDSVGYTVLRNNDELGEFRMKRHFHKFSALSKPITSSECNNMCRVYFDGILVPGVSIPNWVSEGWIGISTFRIVLNIKQNSRTKLDLSRINISYENNDWSNFVYHRCLEAIRQNIKQVVRNRSPKHAYYRLCHLLAYGCGFQSPLEEPITDIDIALLVLDKNGYFKIVPSHKFKNKFINVLAKNLTERLSLKVFKGWSSENWLKTKTNAVQWHGPISVLGDGMAHTLSEMGEEERISCRQAELLQEAWINAFYVLKSIVFLTPEKANIPPLIQEIWVDKRSMVTGAINDISFPNINLNLRENLSKINRSYGYYLPKIVEFNEPFGEYFTAGWLYLNVNHPIVHALNDCINMVLKAQDYGNLDKYNLGLIQDALQPLCGEKSIYILKDYLSQEQIKNKLINIEQLFKLTAKLKIYDMPDKYFQSLDTLNVPHIMKRGLLGTPISSLKIF